MIQEEREQELGWVPNSSPLLLHQGLSLQAALPQAQPLGCDPLTGLEGAPAAGGGSTSSPSSSSVLAVHRAVSHTFFPLTSHCHEMFFFFFKKLSRAPPALGLGCCGPAVELARLCPVRPHAAPASSHRGPCRDTPTPSTKCVGFL